MMYDKYIKKNGEKMDNQTNIDLIRSHVDTIILKSLTNEDKYGYEILKEIENNSKGLFVIKQPTLYSCLKRLEKQQFISSYLGDISNGAQRRYYSLTEAGKQAVLKDQQQWEFSRTIINNLLSDKEFDLENDQPPFDANEFRPLTKRAKRTKVESNEPENFNQHAESTVETFASPDPTPLFSEETNQTSSQEAFYPENDLQRQAEMAQIQNKEEIIYQKINLQEPPVWEESQERVESKKSSVEAFKILYGTPDEYSEIIGTSEQNQISEQNTEEVFEAPQEEPAPLPSYPTEFYNEPAPESILAADLETEKNEGAKNYINSFDAIYKSSQDQTTEMSEPEDNHYDQYISGVQNMAELKNKMYVDGFKLRPYSKKGTNEFYVNNYYFSNRLLRDTFLILYLVFLIEVIVAHFSFASMLNLKIGNMFIVLGVFLAVPLFFVGKYFLNPKKRVRAGFNLKVSLLTSFFICLNLVLIICLVGFLIAGAKAGDVKSMLVPVILPLVFLVNIPLSSLISYLLYRSKRYHMK